MDPVQTAKETLRIEIEALQEAIDRLDERFTKAVDTVLNLKGKLIVTGVGKSGLVGAKMAATLASTGTPSFFLHPTEALHGDLGMIGKEDGLLAISSSGESEELTKILPHVKRFDIPLIAMTGNPDSTLARYADVTLDISVKREACPLNTAPTASTTLTMALGDALAAALMKKRNFKKEDFASFHPGGSLGKKLFIKIKDLMRTENLPVIDESTPLKEAIVVMSEGKLGNVLVTDDEGRLSAVLSDGDLRRALMKENFDLDAPAFAFATKSPKYYDNTDLLASEALEIIEDARIQILPITDEERRIIGVVHIHDLVTAGIKR
jgi:arabinose-5-phosphate isomerase